jgi:hypothetical protein
MQTIVHPAATHFSDRRATGIIAGGATLKTFGGIAVAILAILALIGLIPAVLVAIGGIVFGAAILLEGLSITSQYNQLAHQIAIDRSERVEVGGSGGVELLVGLAAIALGILSLLGVAAPVLIPALIIAGGVGLILSAGSLQRLNDLNLSLLVDSDLGRRIGRNSMMGGEVAQVLGGLGAVVLGILSLVIIAPTAAEGFGTLPQVGLLVLGVASAISGAALAGKTTPEYHKG